MANELNAEQKADAPRVVDVPGSQWLVGNAKTLRAFRQWVQRRSCFCALLIGPPGVGKTSAAHLVLAEAGYHVLECNASLVRKPVEIASTAQAATSAGIGGERNAVVIDEIDGMAGGDEALQPLKSYLERLPHGFRAAPIVLIANSQVERGLRTFAASDLCCTFRFYPLYESDLRKVLVRYLQSRKAVIPVEYQRQLIVQCGGDARALLQSANKYLLAPGADYLLEDHRPERNRSCFQLVEALGNRRQRLHFDDEMAMLRSSECEPSLAMKMIHANYPACFGSDEGDGTTTMQSLASLADTLSQCDIQGRGTLGGMSATACVPAMHAFHHLISTAPSHIVFPNAALFKATPVREWREVETESCRKWIADDEATLDSIMGD